MKISYPRTKTKIRGDGNSHLYAVINKFPDGTWTFADFWGEKYTSASHQEATVMKHRIAKRQKTYEWRNGAVAIMKVTL